MTHDPLLKMLERLPRAEPDATRAERVRARCHAALAGRQGRRDPKRIETRRLWEPAVVGLCSVYLVQVVRQVVHLYGIR